MSYILNFYANILFAAPRSIKRGLVLLIDVVICMVTVWISFYLRMGEWVFMEDSDIIAIITSVLIAIPIFIISGLYKAIFRYSGLPAMIAVTRAVLLYGIAYAGIFTLWGVNGVPRTLGLIQPILLLLLVGASRVMARVLLDGFYDLRPSNSSISLALIYGAGRSGRQLATAMSNNHEIRVIGYLDDDDKLHGSILNGLPIYSPSELHKILNDLSISVVLLAMPNITRKQRNKILTNLRPHKLILRTLPALSDIATGKVKLGDVRHLDIEDLLGREPVRHDNFLIELNVYRKTVLVTGAGGSVGGELCRQLLKLRPKQLVLVEMNEYALYQIHHELQMFLSGIYGNFAQRNYDVDEIIDYSLETTDSSHSGIEIIPLLASVCDRSRMMEIMKTWKPHCVYHAAAYKHVPLVEHNVIEGIRNNVLGTLICAQTAQNNDVSNFVLISTDKAVRPTNVMGATKRLSEMVLQALSGASKSAFSQDDQKFKIHTIFSMVRFGNVLGSSGSVVPLFQEQIKNGGPITLTHPDITRYFMSIPEAAQLVIQAGAMGLGGDVFVLNMGQPIKIIDLARSMVELSGLTVRDEFNPNGDIEIQITGLRPGEKLFEELLIGDNVSPTKHPHIMRAHEHFLNWRELEDKLDKLIFAINENDVSIALNLLQQIIGEYQFSGNIVDWIIQTREQKFKII